MMTSDGKRMPLRVRMHVPILDQKEVASVLLAYGNEGGQEDEVLPDEVDTYVEMETASEAESEVAMPLSERPIPPVPEMSEGFPSPLWGWDDAELDCGPQEWEPDIRRLWDANVRSGRNDLRAQALSLEHLLTHKPFNRWCLTCMLTNTARA